MGIQIIFKIYSNHKLSIFDIKQAGFLLDLEPATASSGVRISTPKQ